MASSFGRFFKISTFGESHCPGVGVVVDGVPPCMELTEADIQTSSIGADRVATSSALKEMKPIRSKFSPASNSEKPSAPLSACWSITKINDLAITVP